MTGSGLTTDRTVGHGAIDLHYCCDDIQSHVFLALPLIVSSQYL